MAKQSGASTSGAEDVRALTSVALDLPLAVASWAIGKGPPDAIPAAAWRTYEASIRLANASVDRVYASRRFANVLNASARTFLRWQRLNAAVGGAFFGVLWRIVGLPTAAEVHAVREDVRALARRLDLEAGRIPRRARAHAKPAAKSRRISAVA
jgi:hypothetical protein